MSDDSKIMPCACICPTQDELHGPGRRVHNMSGKRTGTKTKRPEGWRCTGCGQEKPRDK